MPPFPEAAKIIPAKTIGSQAKMDVDVECLPRPADGTLGAFAAFENGHWLSSDNLADLVRQLPPRGIEPAALYDLAKYGLILAPITLYEGVWSVPAGMTARLLPAGRIDFSPTSLNTVALQKPLGAPNTASPNITIRFAEKPTEPPKNAAATANAPASVGGDEVIRYFIDSLLAIWSPIALPEASLVVAAAVDAPKNATLWIDQPRLPDQTQTDWLFKLLRRKSRKAAHLRGVVFEKMRQDLIAKSAGADGRHTVSAAFFAPEWNKLLAALGNRLKRDLRPWNGQTVHDDIQTISRARFRTKDREGTNLFAFSISRLFLERSLFTDRGPFGITSLSFGPVVTRQGDNADHALTHALLSALSINYLRRFDNSAPQSKLVKKIQARQIN